MDYKNYNKKINAGKILVRMRKRIIPQLHTLLHELSNYLYEKSNYSVMLK
jgi:hypothetical protein